MKTNQKRIHEVTTSEDDAFREIPKKKKKHSSDKNNLITLNEEIAFDSDDEIYHLTCPSGFDINLLKNCDFKFDGNSQIIKKSGEQYNLRFDANETLMDFIMPDTLGHKLVRLPIVGRARTTKRLDYKIEDSSYVCLSDDDEVKFPTDLKLRHPLLGANWKKEKAHSKKRSRLS